MRGCVESIHLAAREGEPTFEVREAIAVTGLGLEGDRLVRKARQSGEALEPGRHLTLIEAEALEALERDYGIALTAGASRRNICTRSVALNHLVGRTFRIGEAWARGVRLCEPCGTLERLSGMKGAAKGLIHRGGLRAEVLEGGVIRTGDPIEPSDEG